jgi:DNA-directed RNA polymerase subunit H (RpoH/RPB5)
MSLSSSSNLQSKSSVETTMNLSDKFEDLITKIQDHRNEKIRHLEFLLYLFIERQKCYGNCNDLYNFDPEAINTLFLEIVNQETLPPVIQIVKNGPGESPFERFDLHIHISTQIDTPSTKIFVKNIGNPLNTGNSSNAGASNASSGFEYHNQNASASERTQRQRPVLLIKNLKTKLSEDPRESGKAKSDDPKEYYRNKVSDEIKNLYVINFDEWFYNPMDHVNQPIFRVLSDANKSAILKKYNVKESGIPKMDCILKDGEKKDSDKDYKGDIVGRFLGFRTGEIVEIHRNTQMNGIQTYYRIAK